MAPLNYDFIINSIDQKLVKLGNRIDRYIIYLLIIDFLGLLNLIRPQWVEDLLPKLLPTDSNFTTLIIPVALFYVFFMVGYTSIWYFKIRRQLNEFLVNYGDTESLGNSETELIKIFTIFRPVSLGEVFYTYYRGIAKKYQPDKKEIMLPYTNWIYMSFTSTINLLLAASNALVLFYCDYFLIGMSKWFALSFFIIAIFICYFDYNKMVKDYTGSTKSMLLLTGFNLVFLISSFIILKIVF